MPDRATRNLDAAVPGAPGVGGTRPVTPGAAPDIDVDQLTVTRVLVETLRPHPENPREGDVAAIAESLTVNGQYRPLVVQAGTGVIVAGNHTWKAAQRLGWEFIDVVMLDIDDQQARRILLADNRLSDLAHYDDAALLLVLQELGTDLDGTGYTAVSVEDLAKLLAPPPSVADLVDETEEPDPADFYPVVKMALPPPEFDRWRQWRSSFDDEDTTALMGLLDLSAAAITVCDRWDDGDVDDDAMGNEIAALRSLAERS